MENSQTNEILRKKVQRDIEVTRKLVLGLSFNHYWIPLVQENDCRTSLSNKIAPQSAILKQNNSANLKQEKT